MALLPLNKQTFNIVPERSGLTEKKKNWTSNVAQGMSQNHVTLGLRRLDKLPAKTNLMISVVYSSLAFRLGTVKGKQNFSSSLVWKESWRTRWSGTRLLNSWWLAI